MLKVLEGKPWSKSEDGQDLDAPFAANLGRLAIRKEAKCSIEVFQFILEGNFARRQHVAEQFLARAGF